jgi:catechol 2,3-dioxygenase-like lactoylglutathione lyase family enzyme
MECAMSAANTYILNYVADPLKSASLYTKLLGREPVESSPGFALFMLPSGVALGLWKRDEVEPRATLPGGTEFCVTVESNDAVHAARKAWAGLGLKILQEPTDMDFGYTFTAADPDGHRLRVFNPSAN